MRKNFGVKPWVYPQPVLMIGTYDENGKPNLMNAAWGGQYDANQVMLCLSSHKTTDNIKVTGRIYRQLCYRFYRYTLRLCGDRLRKAGAKQNGESGLHDGEKQICQRPDHQRAAFDAGM